MAAGLLLLHSRRPIAPEDTHLFRNVESSFPRRITGGIARRLETPRTILTVWSHHASRSAGLRQDERTGNWIALLGNPARADLRNLDGDLLLDALLSEFSEQGAAFARSLSPPFALLLGDGQSGEIHALVDGGGLQHLYVAEGMRTWISSSSLALASGIDTDVDRTAAFEWAATGHFLSNRTFLRNVVKISAGERLLLRADAGLERRSSGWQTAEPQSAPEMEKTYLEAFLSSLHASSADHGLSNELTGGLDSRLVLAGLLHAGEPSLAWTFGDPDCAEIRTIERLRQHVPFAHLVIPIDTSFADGLVDLVREMHELCDGEVNALEYAPLLLAFRVLDGRRTTSLSGAGGEIARGYHHRVLQQPDPGVRNIPLQALVRQLTRSTRILASALRTEAFTDPLTPVSNVLEEMIEQSEEPSPRAILDDIYLRARMQRFAGRNFTTTGLFCRQGLPYFGNQFVAAVRALPAAEKEDGAAARRALMQLSPALASVPLETGRPVRLPDAPPVPETVPWHAVREHRPFCAFARDLVCSPSSSVLEYFPPDFLQTFVEASLSGGALYPLGTLLTLELTLRRVASLRTGARAHSPQPSLGV